MFRNRTEAGKALAAALKQYENVPQLIVLGLPRGGVPVAYQIAAELHVPLMYLSCESWESPAMKNSRLGRSRLVARRSSTIT